MKELPFGLYELLHTKELHDRLEQAGLMDLSDWKKIKSEELHRYLAVPLARTVAGFIQEKVSPSQSEETLEAMERMLLNSREFLDLIETLLPVKKEVLLGIHAEPKSSSAPRPDTPLGQSALLTGSSRTPSLQSQLIKELESCDRADWLVSFIKYPGILPLLPALRKFTAAPSSDGSPRLRIATTSYMGATDTKALRELLTLPNTEIRVSLDTKRTRLHAKAYLFHRDSGFGSAYVGSANVSKAALNAGLEWTAKISQFETQHLWDHAIATFDSHWEDKTEFVPCTAATIEDVAIAIRIERGGVKDESTVIPLFHLRPYGFQQVILEDIAAERMAGKRKHLIIAATGTGKTMVAAFDYRNFRREHGGACRLLFVAHREEILNQAIITFRQVLGDPDFAHKLAGGADPPSHDHLFCTVQSWNSRKLHTLDPRFYDYVVLDEAHHGPAQSYQKLIDSIEPRSLLGLTATPERHDGRDIRNDFGGTFTHELRLPEAVERSLLSPFHFYGIPDYPGVDFSALRWVRGGYDIQELEDLLNTNDGRADWIIRQTDRHVADVRRVRGLGFCVSQAHAYFMAEKFTSAGIPARALTSKSTREERYTIQKQLRYREINFIFTVDLYNEGVDIPFIDTVLFLRPTESVTIFLQQLGRGLRLHEEKAQLTVLDFIAPQNQRFDFISRFRALSMRPQRRIDEQIVSGMPFVPAGCFIQLEQKAQEYVLQNIRNATLRLRGNTFIREIEKLLSHSGRSVTLEHILDWFHLADPDEIYKRGLPSTLTARASGEVTAAEATPDSRYNLHENFRKLLLADDPLLLQDIVHLLTTGRTQYRQTKLLLHSLLWNTKKPEDGSLDTVHRYLLSHPGVRTDLLELIGWLEKRVTPIKGKQCSSTGQLHLHASYTREQVMFSCEKGTFEKPFHTREGVVHVPHSKSDIFFADINKDEADFSPTTMYEDYAITERLFHWQSQAATSEDSPTGRRYINHEREGYTPLLFIRERKKRANGVTSPYFFAGPLQYRRHTGSKPMSIIWELAHPLPARVLEWARRVG
jgi:superfamily II DNA or RNA helicase/HKD family nuclease